MFPSNLHKNILQLDRQIALLESECKNMETNHIKKHLNSKKSYSKSNKASDSQFKPQPVKDTPKKLNGYCNEANQRFKKLTPSNSSKITSSCSLPSNYIKLCNRNAVSILRRKVKNCHVSNSGQESACHIENSNCRCAHKKEKSTRNICRNEQIGINCLKEDCKGSMGCKSNFEEKSDHILHKEVLLSNPGGTIEVTVTQKSKGDNPKLNYPLKKTVSLGTTQYDNEAEQCNCKFKNSQMKGQKWSEILCLNHIKSEPTHSISAAVNQNSQAKNGADPASGQALGENLLKEGLTENHNYKSDASARENFTPPVKLMQSFTKINNMKSEKTEIMSEEINVNKGTQFISQCEETNLFRIFQFFINEVKQSQTAEEKEKVLNDMEANIKKLLSHQEKLCKEFSPGDKQGFIPEFHNQKNDFFEAIKIFCDGLLNEKKSLSEELVNRDKTISAQKKREEEYLSLINDMKLKIEKKKENFQNDHGVTKELNFTKDKLLEQLKVTEALRISHNKMQNLMEKCVLENDKLKTQIQILKLESQKHDVLLAGKEAEIQKYREEIVNFQRQITDHLSSLKSNAQVIDFEKMVEVIFQQSQIFTQGDLDSVVLEKREKDSSKQQNKLMHSSPTSTRTSVVNSSWKQISSIRDNDWNGGNSDVLLNNEIDENEFYQVFGADNASGKELGKNFEVREVKRNLSDKETRKEPSSFTSCLSVCTVEESNDRLSSSKEESLSRGEKKKYIIQQKKEASSKKPQNSIDELLENMKLKWSKEVNGISHDFSIENFLNSSKSSSISVNHEIIQALLIPK